MKFDKFCLLILALFCSHGFACEDLYEKVSGMLFGNAGQSYVTTTWKSGERHAPISVYFGDGENKYKRVVFAPKANCHGCGGIKGNPQGPVGNIQINNGILFLNFQGGSRDYWSDTFKWRFDKKLNDFVLIGETFTSEDTVGTDPKTRIDANFLTGKMESSIGKKKQNCAFKPKEIRLSLFDYEEYKPLTQCSPKKK